MQTLAVPCTEVNRQGFTPACHEALEGMCIFGCMLLPTCLHGYLHNIHFLKMFIYS